MKRILTILGVSVWSLTGTTTAHANDKFWVLWERISHIGQNCPSGAGCLEKRTYASRPLDMPDNEIIYRMFGATSGHKSGATFPAEHPDAPRICNSNFAELSLGFQPEALPRSIKIEALRGIDTVFVDIRNLKSPPGFEENFGEKTHHEFVRILERGGIKVVTEEELSAVPGHPKLAVFFSFTDPDGTCDYEYSVFASLSQDVLLSRDLRIKIEAGVWAFSTGSNSADHFGDEGDAILRVADGLVRDHRKVNSR